jgi:hypothetical protein
VLLVFAGALVYIGGGMLYNMQQGKPLGIPHVRFWNNIYALVVDGVAFASSGGQVAAAPRGNAEGYTGYTPVPVIVGPKAIVSGGATYAPLAGSTSATARLCVHSRTARPTPAALRCAD